MMKSLLTGVAALGLLAAGAASAADLPARKGPVAAPAYFPPAFTWTGFYVGANAGYGFGNIKGTGALNVFDDPDGFIGGGQVGYNYQFGQFVAGLEADLQYSDIKAGANFAGIGVVSKAEIEYFGTVRGRLGVAFDRFLPYVTGGYAFANVKGTLAPGLALNGLNSDDKTHSGYALGAGLEYAFTNNITARAEYLYVDLEKKSYFGNVGKAGADFSVVRGALNYKF